MEDFNSETDSDYTSYWRDWGHCAHGMEDEERLSSVCRPAPAPAPPWWNLSRPGLWHQVLGMLPRRLSQRSATRLPPT
ncbi:hypothetical protein N7516_008262 [Penicillium verrucosum]|uniref:uncharacterized protein n=1 Tax=Penicillium verrucosum TaxID=60171 RepID=UPI002545767D|nr:uncharacterized protein N7516_008262 [Penicillium verrucosum]KAJ5926489.1 hypothetical protein N7516_008262 [Penicillium verrucosum]